MTVSKDAPQQCPYLSQCRLHDIQRGKGDNSGRRTCRTQRSRTLSATMSMANTPVKSLYGTKIDSTENDTLQEGMHAGRTVADPPSPPMSIANAPAKSVYGPKRPNPVAIKHERARGQEMLLPRRASCDMEMRDSARKNMGMRALFFCPSRSLRYPHKTVEITPCRP